MTDYEYDPDLPYVVEVGGLMLARTKQPQHARYLASAYVKSAKVIDTTPKPRVPEDAEFILWLDEDEYPQFARRATAGTNRWQRSGWCGSVQFKDLPSVTPDTVFTVLEERKI